jgi:hypothetical protein
MIAVFSRFYLMISQEPPERFQFVAAKPNDARVILSV